VVYRREGARVELKDSDVKTEEIIVMRVETCSQIVSLVSTASVLALMPPSRCHVQAGAPRLKPRDKA